MLIGNRTHPTCSVIHEQLERLTLQFHKPSVKAETAMQGNFFGQSYESCWFILALISRGNAAAHRLPNPGCQR